MELLDFSLPCLELAAEIPYRFILSSDQVLEHPIHVKRRRLITIASRWLRGFLLVRKFHHPGETLGARLLMCMEISVAYAPPNRDFGYPQMLGSLFDGKLYQLVSTSCSCALTRS